MSAPSPSRAAAQAAEAYLAPDRLAAVLAGLLPHLAVARIDAAARSLAPRFHPLQAPPKVALLRQGEVWQRAFLIQSGLVRMHFVDRDGHEFNKNFHAEGSLICPIAPAMWLEPSLFGIHTIEELLTPRQRLLMVTMCEVLADLQATIETEASAAGLDTEREAGPTWFVCRPCAAPATCWPVPQR